MTPIADPGRLKRFHLSQQDGSDLAFIWARSASEAIERYTTEFYPGRTPGWIWRLM